MQHYLSFQKLFHFWKSYSHIGVFQSNGCGDFLPHSFIRNTIYLNKKFKLISQSLDCTPDHSTRSISGECTVAQRGAWARGIDKRVDTPRHTSRQSLESTATKMEEMKRGFQPVMLIYLPPHANWTARTRPPLCNLQLKKIKSTFKKKMKIPMFL